MADLQQKNVVIRQKDVEIRQKDVQLEHHVTTVQQLTSQLREREGRLRQREEELQQKDTQIQLKDKVIQQKNADISRLQRKKQVGVKMNASYDFTIIVQTFQGTKKHKIIFFMQCISLQESLLRVTQHSAAKQRPIIKVAIIKFVTMNKNNY